MERKQKGQGSLSLGLIVACAVRDLNMSVNIPAWPAMLGRSPILFGSLRTFRSPERAGCRGRSLSVTLESRVQRHVPGEEAPRASRNEWSFAPETVTKAIGRLAWVWGDSDDGKPVNT